MPPSLDRTLIHRYEVIQQISLLIGMLSEEDQESRNKDFKKFREHFLRICSKTKNNMDVLRRLLCSSDPLISSYKKKSSITKEPFEPEVVQLLKSPSLPGTVDL